MSNNLNILFIGQKQPVAETVLSQFGKITYGSDSDLKGYDLVALLGDSYAGDFPKLFETVWESGTSLGVFNITPEQVTVVTNATGIAPSGTAQGVLAARGNDGAEHFSQVRYLLEYPKEVMDAAAQNGLNASDLINSFMVAGIESHFEALHPEVNILNRPTNFLIPQYSLQPFSLVRVPAKSLVQPIANMQNISNITMQVASQLYCYNENGANNNEYIVIIVTQLNAISNGNPVSYTRFNAPSCGSCTFNYEWSQYFAYNLRIIAQNAAGQPYASGLTVYDSSPVNGNTGQTQIVNSIGVPNPFTIYMRVLNGGTWQLANFPASYINTINTDTVRWFNIRTQNNQPAATAGVEFSIPTNVTGGRLGDREPRQVNFEVITAFKFENSLVVDGKLPLRFQFNLGMNMTQRYTQLIMCSGGGSPVTTVTQAGGTQSFNTDTYDLVVLTQNRSPIENP